MRGRWLAWLLLLWLTACSAEDGGIGARHATIAGGEREMGEPAVVVIRIAGGVGLCTGTLVAPKVVLTAKHCIQLPSAEQPMPPSLVTVGVGHSVSDTVDFRVQRIDTTPGVYTSSPETGIGTGLIGSDVAVLTLRESPLEGMDIQPIPVRRDPPDDMIGETFTAIGFGQTDTGGSGQKYTGTGTLEDISGNVLFSAMTICQGDSGGPMIQETPERRVIGVASFGEAGECPSRRDGHNRVDPFLGLIDGAILESGGCPVMQEEVCDSIDNDCDDVVDEGCAGLGEACDTDADCAYAQLPERFEPLETATVCAETSAGRVCTRPCDPVHPTRSCDEVDLPFGRRVAVEGVYCGRTGGCGGTCLPGSPGDLGNAEPCERDTECASLACFDPGDGTRRCLTTCRGGAGICPADEVCAATVGACGGCVPPEVVSGARALGEPCAADEDCGSGACLGAESDAGYCTRSCINDVDCPSGFHCREELCWRGPPGEVGDPCEIGDDCRVGLECRDDGARRLCSRDCDEPSVCGGDGFVCLDEAEGGLCRPEAGLIGEPCEEDADCASGLCGDVGEGSAACTRPCGSEGFCPHGYECRRASDGVGARCVVPSSGGGGGGGCRVGGDGAPASGAALLALAWLLLRRRRGRGPV